MICISSGLVSAAWSDFLLHTGGRVHPSGDASSSTRVGRLDSSLVSRFPILYSRVRRISRVNENKASLRRETVSPPSTLVCALFKLMRSIEKTTREENNMYVERWKSEKRNGKADRSADQSILVDSTAAPLNHHLSSSSIALTIGESFSLVKDFAAVAAKKK